MIGMEEMPRVFIESFGNPSFEEGTQYAPIQIMYREVSSPVAPLDSRHNVVRLQFAPCYSNSDTTKH